jgi:hypothetical protein
MTKQSELLSRLNDWYSGQCDGDWEHRYGITIETLDNPGWRMRIDLIGTPLLDRADFKKHDNEGDPRRWMVLRKNGAIFEAAGAPETLSGLIAGFLQWKDDSND